IDDAIAKGHENAILANNILVYEIKKYIGSYAAAMGGVDAIVFTAGLGENNVALRHDVCSGLEFLGVELDEARNEKAFRQSDNMEISKEGSKVKVYVIPTNEELVIAMDTAELVKKNG
ncbi:MAG: acetate kinase, partial [Clostridia bacterium]|nr:acetate kinase [Clostridia bacterium]